MRPQKIAQVAAAGGVVDRLFTIVNVAGGAVFIYAETTSYLQPVKRVQKPVIFWADKPGLNRHAHKRVRGKTTNFPYFRQGVLD